MAAPGGSGRMLCPRKQDVVPGPLRGEDLETTVSCALGVTAATLGGRRDAFPSAAEARLASRPTDGEDLESEPLKTRPGAMLLERERLEARIAAADAGRSVARRRSWP